MTLARIEEENGWIDEWMVEIPKIMMFVESPQRIAVIFCLRCGHHCRHARREYLIVEFQVRESALVD